MLVVPFGESLIDERYRLVVARGVGVSATASVSSNERVEVGVRASFVTRTVKVVMRTAAVETGTHPCVPSARVAVIGALVTRSTVFDGVLVGDSWSRLRTTNQRRAVETCRCGDVVDVGQSRGWR